ncbi:hypothetical protein NLI96_g8647 [Meripilus lineatus]|uniref:BTB domain-containing protein n=1 Tax=Meripilus lineatus TaxID=2056292 RepID=A0AAD5V252_9APHY|nr:hypothetical protein NLI96_g8647 [Physisporinus lineatus]
MDDKLRSTGPSPSVAKSPFDDTSADVVLRSSDHLDFYVHKLILSLASPFFKDMFSLNQPSIAHDTIPPAPHSNPHPIIPVTESGFTLDYILRFIYPVAEPSPPTTSTQVDHILEASMKYEIEKSALKMKEALLTFIESEPITVFVIACRLVLEDEAGAAATALKSLKPASIVMCPISHVPIDACNRGCRNWCNNFDASGRPLTCGCHEFHGYPIPIEGDSPREFALTIESAIFTKEMENMPAGPYFRLLRYIKDKDHPLTLCFPPPSARVYTTKVDIPPWRRIDADIILESRDGIQLPVHRLILSLVSAKETLLDNPQSSSSVEGGLPVICLDEDAITLHIFAPDFVTPSLRREVLSISNNLCSLGKQQRNTTFPRRPPLLGT